MTHQPFVFQDVPGPPRDMVGYGRHAPRARWPDNARIAINLVINYEEGSEYTHPAGDGRNDGLTEVIYSMDPAYRDLAAESVFEQARAPELAAGAAADRIQAAGHILCRRGRH